MNTTSSISTSLVSATTLLADYSHWLNVAHASRRIIRQYDRRLAQLANRYPDLSDLSNYLRACMHQRSQFFGDLTLLLTGKVAQLRAEPTNETLIRQLSHAHLTMQTLMTQLMDTFTEIDESYQLLFPPRRYPKDLPQPPVPTRQTYRA